MGGGGGAVNRLFRILEVIGFLAVTGFLAAGRAAGFLVPAVAPAAFPLPPAARRGAGAALPRDDPAVLRAVAVVLILLLVAVLLLLLLFKLLLPDDLSFICRLGGIRIGQMVFGVFYPLN